MLYFYSLLREGDLCTLLFAIVGLYYIGRLFVLDRPQWQSWGVRLAAVAFIMCALLRLMEAHRPNADDILSAAVVGAFAAGFAVGPAWIVIGMIGFLADQLHLVREAVTRHITRRRRARQERRRHAENERLQRERQLQEQRLSPTRQRQCKEDLERKQAQRKHEEEQRKRDSLRLDAELELEFALDQDHRERLRNLVNQFTDESLPLDEYQHRMEAIRDSITRNTNRSRNYQSITEVVQEFDQRLADLDPMALTPEEKDSLRALLMMERQEAVQRFMQR